ncbi:MAG: glycosyltransferase family 4 protein [Terriglobia bacterium]
MAARIDVKKPFLWPADGRVLNVCMIAYAPYEHDSRQVSYATALAESGHILDVIAPRPKAGQRAGATDRVHLHPILSREPGEDSPAVYLLKCLWFFLCTAFVVAVRDLRKHYDLVHVHSMPDLLVFAAFLPRLRGARVILDIHDLFPEFYLSKFGKTRRSLIYRLLLHIERISAHFADHVIASNDLWRDKLASRAVQAAKCTTILNYPDRSFFGERGGVRSDQRTLILYPGTLSRHQGVDIAIRAFRLIAEKVPDAEFHIYGTGPEKEKLSRLVRDLNLAARVKFFGMMPHETMPSLLRSADIGVVPKRNDAFGDEAFSTKTLEFMAMGIPVVVADTKIDRYYFDDGVVKFFRAGDEVSLAEALLAVISDRKLQARLARNASEFVAARGWQSHRSQYLDLVSHLIGSFRVAAPPAAFPGAQSGGRGACR